LRELRCGLSRRIRVLRTRAGQLEQQILDLRQELQDRTDDLDASRASNRDLMTLASRTSAMTQPETAGI
jgi:hypothetical protein